MHDTAWASIIALMLQVEPDRFEQLVADALDVIPDELAQRMDNVAVMIEPRARRGGLLGLYEGVPLTERGSSYGGYGEIPLPDRITIYRDAILEVCWDEAEVVHQVKVTVIHEIAHHFGISDERLDELGWA